MYTRVDDIFEAHRDLIVEMLGERCHPESIVDRVAETETLSEAERRELHDTIVSL